MNELVPIQTQQIDGQEVNCVNARELHEFLGSKQQYSDWIRGRIKKYGFTVSYDFWSNLTKSPGGRPKKEYYITLDMAKELCMVENNEKGREARRYFIEVEKKYRAGLMAAIPKENIHEIISRRTVLKMAYEAEGELVQMKNRLNLAEGKVKVLEDRLKRKDELIRNVIFKLVDMKAQLEQFNYTVELNLQERSELNYFLDREGYYKLTQQEALWVEEMRKRGD